MKHIKKFGFLLLIGIVILASVASSKPAKATSCTITLSAGQFGYPFHLDADQVCGGYIPNIFGSNKGYDVYQLDTGTIQWENGDGTTLFIDVRYYEDDDNQISFNSAVNNYTLVSNLTGYTADNTSHIFRAWGTPCHNPAGTVTHTSPQSDVWHNFGDSIHAEAEWSGLMKYNPPTGGCDIKIKYTLGAGTPTFRASGTDAHYAQWPSNYLNCPFTDYPADKNVECSYTAVTSQISHKVKLFATPTSFTTGTFVEVEVYEKDSNGWYIHIANPGGVAGWTFN